MSTIFEASWDQLKAAEAEIKRLRAALRQIIAEADSDDGMTAWDGSEIARKALGFRPDEMLESLPTESAMKIDFPDHPVGPWQLIPDWISWLSGKRMRRRHWRWTVDHKGCRCSFYWEYR